MTRNEMTEPRPRIQAALATGAMLVEHCDVPEGQTLCEWRRATAAATPPKRRPLLRRVFGRAA
jgi:hypothetical protein